MQRSIALLGATGSIGRSTLDVIERNPGHFRLFAVSAHSNQAALLDICRRFSPVYAVYSGIIDERALRDDFLAAGLTTTLLTGTRALEDIASDPAVNTVVAAIVGAAGLLPALAAVKAGKRVLLANKEALVMSGHLFMDAVRHYGAQLLPIDSEHNAIFQCLPFAAQSQAATDVTERFGIRRILLTASGGPFLHSTLDELQRVTPEQACKHPRWAMGRKISVDSATLMNKGLELIEACWLFAVKPDVVDVHIHPQAIVHSMVEYIDGSILAQLGCPDMRTPIANALAWPDRVVSGVSPLDLFRMGPLEFSEPDLTRFPCLRLAAEAHRAGGLAAAILNAANEMAVAAFLETRIAFMDIPQVIAECLDSVSGGKVDSIEAVLAVDTETRRSALACIDRIQA
jgi:1-deoxy-D-xylulose-5-phosphate reductoisomerase